MGEIIFIIMQTNKNSKKSCVLILKIDIKILLKYKT
jgi:hypothetical protein